MRGGKPKQHHGEVGHWSCWSRRLIEGKGLAVVLEELTDKSTIAITQRELTTTSQQISESPPPPAARAVFGGGGGITRGLPVEEQERLGCMKREVTKKSWQYLNKIVL